MSDWLYPSEDFPLQHWVKNVIQAQLTIEEMEPGPDHAEFVQNLAKYIVTGIEDSDPEDCKQVNLTVMDYVLNNPALPTLRRDYDSLLGFMMDIPVDAPLFIYSIARKRDTLSEPLHVTIKMRTEQDAPVSTILLYCNQDPC
jgi:hypothetical protein